MAFSFGNTAQPTFGASSSKPTAFGAPFGVTTTANTGFGGFGSSSFGTASQPANVFGATAAQPSTAFGATSQPSTGFGTSFGAQPTATPAFGAQPTATPVFGTPAAVAPAFGAQAPATAAFGSNAFGTTTPAPAFGTAFGTPASTAPSFGTNFGGTGTTLFGTSTTKPSLFGTPTTSTSLFATPTTTPSLFGTPATSQPPSLFGNAPTTTPGLFGATGSNLFGATTTTAPSLFGSSFGTTTTSAPSLFGTPANTGTNGFGLFGNTTTTSTPSLFGGFGTGQTTAGGFGAQPTTGFGGFGSTTGGFGMQSSTLFGGGFGAKPAVPTATSQSMLSTQQQQTQQVLASIYTISIFNDERDEILKKWNLLQACWGVGKGYYNQALPPVEYTQCNPFYRFKAVGYNAILKYDNAEGIVKLGFNKKFAEVSAQKQVLINGINAILGSKPNLKVVIHQIKTLSDTQSEIRLVVTEKGVTGTSRKIPATDLANYLNQPTHKQQLATVGVVSIVPYITPPKTAIDEHIRVVPQGFDPQVWKAAIADNPDPENYMPVPIYGFSDLKDRQQRQEHETKIQKAFEEKVSNELSELKKKNAASTAKINELKLRFSHLQHRTLKILVKQESVRKNGIAIQPEEELLKGKLETISAHLNIPVHFKGKLNELISSVSFMEDANRQVQPQYRLVQESQAELKDFLQMQQNGISKLVDIVKDDMRCLNIMTEGMRQILQNQV